MYIVIIEVCETSYDINCISLSRTDKETTRVQLGF